MWLEKPKKEQDRTNAEKKKPERSLEGQCPKAEMRRETDEKS